MGRRNSKGDQMIRVFIDDVMRGNSYRLSVIDDLGGISQEYAVLKINKNGKFEWKKCGVLVSNPDCTVEIRDIRSREILQAMSDELGRIGYFPQASHRDQIKAEALVEEKEKKYTEQIGWLRKLVEAKWEKK